LPQDSVLSATQRATERTLPAYSLHLDVIRGLASLLVLVGHLHLIVTGHVNAAPSAPEAGGGTVLAHPAGPTGLGHASVVIFFVLSGYLVGGSVLRDLKRRTFSFGKYAVRRLTRLWTVLLPAIALGLLMDKLSAHFFAGSQTFARGSFTGGALAPVKVWTILKVILFLQSTTLFQCTLGTNVSLWSLSNEFWYYILFAVFAVCLAGKSRPAWQRVSLGILGCLLLWFVGAPIASYFPLWLCGVVAYLIPARIPSTWRSVSSTAMAVQFCAVLYFMRSHAEAPLMADTLITISFMLLLYAVLHQLEAAREGLHSKFAHASSFPSYSLYTVHVPACILLAALLDTHVRKLAQHDTTLIVAVFLGVLIYAGLFYFAFERNTDRIRIFLESRLSARGSAHQPL
jgi:peptidoglycan/LPS O-acetylase OafA/YrhL